MSRAKSRQNVEVCGDCGAQDPTWASLNRGILLCSNCCSVHRSLGRHISQVKSLQKSTWNSSQFAMISALSSGANSIWEHALLENNSKFSKRKPSAKDPLSIKSEFIRAKHQHYHYVFRPRSEDGMLCVENELGKQLHASVRTGNLETSFRLLIQGADPNYFHDEKGTTPLHVAVKSCQALQLELLMVYGADPTSPDAQGKTPVDYARLGINKEILNRLIEWQYEVTDKFSNYLTHRKPDHQNGVHFLLPNTGFKSEVNSMAKLKKLSNHLFEELAMDVYDEIDRREIEAIWLSSIDTVDLNTVPFLPVDQTLSTTRNQGRQKLARFSTPELKSLVYDILIETQRRQLNTEKALLLGKNQLPQLREYSQISDDDPLYDSVASDDDYAVVTNDIEKFTPQSPSQNHQQPVSPVISTEQFKELTKKLQASDSTITDLRAEVCKLRACVESLQNENDELKTRLSLAKSEVHTQVDLPLVNAHNRLNGDSGSQSMDGILMNDSKAPIANGRVIDIDLRSGRRNQRPSSMYETREGLRTPNWQALKNQLKQNEQRNTIQGLCSTSQAQTIIQCTEHVTKGIQMLCKCLQGPDRENCISSANKIRYAVTNLAAALHNDTEGDLVRNLLDTVNKLQEECARLQIVNKKRDISQTDHHLLKIRECAYNIAKDTKQIVTKYTTTTN